jgi:hypothetical protein
MDYVTFSYLLVEILREMGHKVDHRKVTVGEELDYVYDFAFCGVAPLSSMTSGRVPETHWAIDCMEGKHAVYADDWSFCGFGKSVKGALNNWDKYLKYKNFSHTPVQLDDTFLSLQSMVENESRFSNGFVLAPMFPWGDHDFLMKDNYEARLVTVDPSAWVKYPTVDIPTFAEKKKQWVMAALSDHSNWVKKQGFKLPVQYIGNKRMGVEVLSESKTVQRFADSYGVLACGYPSAGSGWWRTRYLNAAWAESLVYCDLADQRIMDAPYQWTSSALEGLDYEGYVSIVQDQNEWLRGNISKKEEVFETLERLMKK